MSETISDPNAVSVPSTASTPKKSADSDKDLLATMRGRLTMAQGAYSESRESELNDLKFMAGSPDNNWQWPDDIVTSRTGSGDGTASRPTLTINKLPQHVRQVTNDQRQNRPTAKVIPVDDGADVDVAEVFDGIIRHIEYISDADVAYDTACDNQVTYGEGYVRLLTEYVSDDSFDQDIKIGRIRNSFSVYMDPMIQDPCGSDAEWCFVTQDMTKTEYEQKFPDALPITSLQDQGVGDSSLSAWLDEDTVRIAEYYYLERSTGTLNEYPAGQIAVSGTPQDKQLRQFLGPPKRSRKVVTKSVKCIKTNGYEVLESWDWPGQWIPIVRIVGNEFEIDGQLHVSGLVRNAKDAQRMYNYWVSQNAEMLALAPKAPFVGYAGQFEGYENEWKSANTKNWSYLEVNHMVDEAGTILPLPQRMQPVMPQAGLLQAQMSAADDIKATTGQYDPSLGAQSNETSGKAIVAREKQSDTGTFHYIDNLSRGIRHVGRQLVDLIPKIYDTKRVARIIGADGTASMAKMDPTAPQAVNKVQDAEGVVIEKVYNPTIGTYDVMVKTGPGYSSQREEALNSMVMLLQAQPDLWHVIGDLVVEHMDWPGAQPIAKRLKAVLDPKVLAAENADDPQVQQMKQQIEVLQQHFQQAVGMLQNVERSKEAVELKIQEFDAETRRIAAVQKGMTPEQMQDIALGVVHAAIANGDFGSPTGDPSIPAPQIPTAPMGAQPMAQPGGVQPPSPQAPTAPPSSAGPPGLGQPPIGPPNA